MYAISDAVSVFNHCDGLTSIGQTPTVCVFAQQAAERVSVLVQVDIGSADPHHLLRKRGRPRIKRRPLHLFFRLCGNSCKAWKCGRVTMSVPYTGDVILISQKCCPSASSLEPRMAAVPQLYSEWKLTLRLSQVSSVAVDRLLPSQTQSNSASNRQETRNSSLCCAQFKS